MQVHALVPTSTPSLPRTVSWPPLRPSSAGQLICRQFCGPLQGNSQVLVNRTPGGPPCRHLRMSSTTAGLSRTMVLNLFGTRNRFLRRQFFHGEKFMSTNTLDASHKQVKIEFAFLSEPNATLDLTGGRAQAVM